VGLFDVTSSALEVAIRGTEQRQTVLANNLANVNTPGFKRSDVSFQGALADALQSSGGDPSVVDATPFQTTTDSSTSMRADGNNVDVDSESANLAKNQLLFDSVMAIDTKRLHTMDTAITGAH
jgi:flagellar basal-body rod protein FlgB